MVFDRHGPQLRVVGLGVVSAEEQFAATGKHDPHIRLRAAPVAPVEVGQRRFGSGSSHTIFNSLRRDLVPARWCDGSLTTELAIDPR